MLRAVSGPELLRAWIDRSKVTQRQAAAVIGISEAKLSEYLSGKVRPGLTVAVRIEDATGVSARSWQLTRLSKTRSARRATHEIDQSFPSRKA